jgi:hypothetical protein
MALTYEESAALMGDAGFRGRVKVACLKYADYISNEATGTPAHVTRLRWSGNTMANPDAAAALVTPAVVMDTNVQADGAAIDDVTLQSAVETTINKMM